MSRPADERAGNTVPRDGMTPHPGSGTAWGADPHGAPPAVPPAAVAWSPETMPLEAIPVTPPRRRIELSVVLLSAVIVAALGAPLGALWSWLAPGIDMIRTPNGAVYTTAQPEGYIAADGVFLLMGLGFGVVVAVAAWLLLPRYRGPAMIIAITAGSVAAAWIASEVGIRIEQANFERVIADLQPGDHFQWPNELRARGVLMVAGLATAFTGTLLAGWSRYPDLRRPTEEERQAAIAQWYAAAMEEETPLADPRTPGATAAVTQDGAPYVALSGGEPRAYPGPYGAPGTWAGSGAPASSGSWEPGTPPAAPEPPEAPQAGSPRD